MSKNRIEKLSQLLSRIETRIPYEAIKNDAVSTSTIGWQIDHTLKVFNAVSQWTENSNPDDYKYKFSLWRSVLFPLGYIPRGKVRAPKATQPPDIILKEAILNQIQIAYTHIEKLKTLPKNSYFNHFIFGNLPKKKTLRFLEMHTNHHLKIIEDILKK